MKKEKSASHNALGQKNVASADKYRETHKNLAGGKIDGKEDLLQPFGEETEIPYAKVEFYHPATKKHQVVEFTPDTTSGYDWVEPVKVKIPSRLQWFLLGMLWAVVLASLLWVVVR